MKTTTATQIKDTANKLSSIGKKWHFHILTPECQLNENNNYALILENLSDNEDFVCCSNEPYVDVGKELVKLLHGSDIVKKKGEEQKSKPSPQVTKLLLRARKLNSQGKNWHHHMLFPGCVFNKHKSKFVIIFEDKDTGNIIESVSDKEPKGDLKHIETLYYAQKKAE